VQLTYRGSVNRWECDENDHLNVRFYVQKHWQTLTAGMTRQGYQDHQVRSALTVQHLRFLEESRLSTPISGYVRVIGIVDRQLHVLTELRDSFSQTVLCTCVHQLDDLVASGEGGLPEYAGPRGIEAQASPFTTLNPAQALERGFQMIGAGVIQSDECDDAGVLSVHHYMGRISDSMPHLWGELSSNEGGAVLEYRLEYHEPLRCHEAFNVVSGIADVGPKVQKFAHLIFKANNDRLAVSAQAAAVRMDLQARRAMTLSADEQRRLVGHMIKPSSG